MYGNCTKGKFIRVLFSKITWLYDTIITNRFIIIFKGGSLKHLPNPENPCEIDSIRYIYLFSQLWRWTELFSYSGLLKYSKSIFFFNRHDTTLWPPIRKNERLRRDVLFLLLTSISWIEILVNQNTNACIMSLSSELGW